MPAAQLAEAGEFFLLHELSLSGFGRSIAAWISSFCSASREICLYVFDVATEENGTNRHKKQPNNQKEIKFYSLLCMAKFFSRQMYSTPALDSKSVCGKCANIGSLSLVKNFFLNQAKSKLWKHYQVIEILKNGIEILMSRAMSISTSVYLLSSPETPYSLPTIVKLESSLLSCL